MGSQLSRAVGGRGAAGDANDSGRTGAGANAYRYPPRSGHPYFASHFIMGGEKFESSQPENFLFGDNCDLNHLSSRPVAFPYPPPQANEPTKTLRSLMNIRKDSVHLAAVDPISDAATEQRCYNLQFTFDSDVRCAITVYYFCTEDVTSSGVVYSSKHPELTSSTYEYFRGANQVFNQKSHIICPANHIEDLENMELIPVAIHCVALEGDSNPPQAHITVGIIERYNSDGSYVVKGLKQKIFVDGLVYLLQEIYGLENKSLDAKQYSDDDVDDSGAECVVCMSDLRDTIIMPCRHLCLCNACADSLRYQANNCPICRAPFRALLQIRAVCKVGHQATHPALADPEASMEGIPPGYIPISLIEALNGPSQSSLAQAATGVVVAAAAGDAASSERGSKSRKGKSSKRGRAPSQDAPSDPSVAHTGSSSALQRQNSLPMASSSVSLHYVSEVANQSSPRLSSIDLVEEELANMAKISVTESMEEVPLCSTVDGEHGSGDADDEEEEDEAIVVNLAKNRQLAGVATKSSQPGTPTSLTSVRSSQDSASSASSTKHLLSAAHQQKSVEAGSVIVVKVHPSGELPEGDEEEC